MKFPVWLVALHMTIVVVVVLTLLILMKNPLALLGLLMMPQVPSLITTAGDALEEADGRGIGFHADPGGDDQDD